MEPSGVPDDVADHVEQLLTVDVNGKGIVGELAAAARERHGRAPLAVAADRLAAAVDSGSHVVIATGFPVGDGLVQETDGPLGAASLARAVRVGLDAKPVVVAEAGARESVVAAARAYGLNAVERGALGADWSLAFEAFPTDRDAAAAAADDLLAACDVSAAVAVERCGATPDGEYYTLTGTDITDATAKTEPLFERTDALTVGVGDGGNELGMGAIRDRVVEAVPRGDRIGAASHTDVAVVATVSNWGAYGVAGLLSTVVEGATLHQPDREARALRACGLAGAVDGATGRTDGYCDGLSPASHRGVVRLIHDAVGAKAEFYD
jgi:hypothetical protein